MEPNNVWELYRCLHEYRQYFFPKQTGNFYNLEFMIPTKYSNFVVVVVVVFQVPQTNFGIKERWRFRQCFWKASCHVTNLPQSVFCIFLSCRKSLLST